METRGILLRICTTSPFPLAGKLIEWKLLATCSYLKQIVSFPLAGKLIEWKPSADMYSSMSTSNFPLAGKLIEWKPE